VHLPGPTKSLGDLLFLISKENLLLSQCLFALLNFGSQFFNMLLATILALCDCVTKY
jgi:hypothetical protein